VTGNCRHRACRPHRLLDYRYLAGVHEPSQQEVQNYHRRQRSTYHKPTPHERCVDLTDPSSRRAKRKLDLAPLLVADDVGPMEKELGDDAWESVCESVYIFDPAPSAVGEAVARTYLT
jgi:hypothetical protein